MNIERLKKLEKLHEIEPDDPFLIYAIAIEWMRDDPAKAIKLFDKLLSEHEMYIGTYYQAAKLYSEAGDVERAEKIYLKGIEIAEEQNDYHSLRELKSAYNEFIFGNEDM